MATASTHIEDLATRTNAEKFEPQCFLMDNWEFFVNKNSFKEYRNFFTVDSQDYSDAAAFINKFSNAKYFQTLMGFNALKLNLLTPSFSLYKVWPNKFSKGEPLTKEFVFSRTYDSDIEQRILEEHCGVFTNVSLTSFTWEFSGKNESSVNSYIDATLSLHLESISALCRGNCKERIDFERPEVEVIDLILPPTGKERTTPAHVYEPEYYRIKVRMSYKPQKGAEEYFTKEELEMLRKNALILDLVSPTHEIEIDEAGGVDLTIKYVAAIDSLTGYDTASSNILYREELMKKLESLKKEKKESEKRIDEIDDCIKKDKETKKLEALRESEKEKLDAIKEDLYSEKTAVYSSFLKRLIEVGRIRRLVLSAKDAEEWLESVKNKTVPRFNMSSYEDQISIISASEKERYRKWIVDGKEAEARESFTPARPDQVVVNYVFFGDLLEAALERIVISNEFNMIVGSFLFKDPRRSSDADPYRVISLADVPVSLDRFVLWFIDTIIKPQKYEMSYEDFVKSILTKIVEPGMSVCFEDTTFHSKANVNMTLVRIPRDLAGGRTLMPRRRLKVSSLLSYLESFEASLQDQSCVVLFSGIFAKGRTANYINDLRDGIPHFKMLQKQGVQRAIKYTLEDMKYRRSSIIASEFKHAGELARLRGMYNASVELIGLTMFLPGQYIYIDPTLPGLGSALERKALAMTLGLGGYYIITKVEGSYKEGAFLTTLTTKWESKGDGTQPNPDEPEDRCAHMSKMVTSEMVDKYNDEQDSVPLTLAKGRLTFGGRLGR